MKRDKTLSRTMMAYLAALFFQTTTGPTIFVVVYALWMLSEIVVGGIIPSLRRHGVPIRYEDKGSRPLIAVSMILALDIAHLCRVWYCGVTELEFLRRD